MAERNNFFPTGEMVPSVDIAKNGESAENMRSALRRVVANSTVEQLVEIMERVWSGEQDGLGIDYRNFMRYVELDMKETRTEDGKDDLDPYRKKAREAIARFEEKHNIH